MVAMPDLTLDLRYLRFAVAAAKYGSFRQAAISLDVSQSTVSRRIQLLEHRLGFEMFRRDRKGAHLTATGENFLKEAVLGMHQLRRAVQLAGARLRGEAGELNIGILASLAAGFLHLALKEFRERHPGVKITLHEGTAEENLHRLALGGLDIAFVTGKPNFPGHTSEVLWNESIFFVLPASHELSSKAELAWEDVRGETFVVSSGGPGPEIQDYLIKNLADAGLRPSIDVHDVSRESLIDLVAIGYGLTLTSTSAVRPAVTGVVFKALVGSEERLPSSAVWSSDNVNPALQNLLKLVKVVARAYARKSGWAALCAVLAFMPMKVESDLESFAVEPAQIHGRFL
jgi:DNA-binding transcriptional LysR family regulator